MCIRDRQCGGEAQAEDADILGEGCVILDVSGLLTGNPASTACRALGGHHAGGGGAGVNIHRIGAELCTQAVSIVAGGQAELATVARLVVLGSVNDEVLGITNLVVRILREGPARYAVATLGKIVVECEVCLLYTSPSPRDVEESRMPSSA